MAKKQLKVCMIGFGHAARALCRLLLDKAEEIYAEYDTEILVTAISGRSKGSVMNPSGIDLEELLCTYNLTGKLQITGTPSIKGMPSTVSETSTEMQIAKEASLKNDLDIGTLGLIDHCEADVMIELSTLSIMDGQPAIRHIEKAFDRELHVITANKGPIAWDFQRLSALAQERGLVFLYETTVMDGTPIFNLVKETLHGCKVLSFKGILNSTTNFILTEMEKGSSFSEAVIEAQRRGFAEADPSMDVDGWDAAAKTAAIANVLLSANLRPTDIRRTGIEGITAEEIRAARADHKKIKLLCEGYMDQGHAVGLVHPVYFPDSALYSTIDATSSILSITTDLMGEISIIEKDPEIEQTAYGIYSDLLTLIKMTAISSVAHGEA